MRSGTDIPTGMFGWEEDAMPYIHCESIYLGNCLDFEIATDASRGELVTVSLYGFCCCSLGTLRALY